MKQITNNTNKNNLFLSKLWMIAVVLTCSLSLTSCDEIMETMFGEWDKPVPKMGNPGTPQRTYSLDWKITNEKQHYTVLEGVLGGALKNEVDQIVFEYSSVGPDLTTAVRLTGSITMPTKIFNKEEAAENVVIINQWTTAKYNERISQGYVEGFCFLTNPLESNIIISSDYYGWTNTVDKPQAYSCPEISAVEQMDCFDAAMEILKAKGYEVSNVPISNIGYSGGGVLALGLQRFIDEKRPDINIVFTAGGASNYDINAVWDGYIEKNESSLISALAMIVVAYNETYHLGLNYHDVFQAPLCDHVDDWILSKQYGTWEINSKIGTKKITELMTPQVFDFSKGPGKVLRDKFQEVTLCGSNCTWVPNKKTQFFIMHSTKDSYLPNNASLMMYDYLNNRGCKVAKDFEDDGDHLDAGAIFFLEAAIAMENITNDEDITEFINNLSTIISDLRELLKDTDLISI